MMIMIIMTVIITEWQKRGLSDLNSDLSDLWELSDSVSRPDICAVSSSDTDTSLSRPFVGRPFVGRPFVGRPFGIVVL